MSVKLIAPLKKDTLSELYLNKDVKKGNHYSMWNLLERNGL